MSRNYDNIINMPHHTSSKYKRMSRENRAAQFSPFAALTGFDDEIVETARLTETFKELSEEDTKSLDEKINRLLEIIKEKPHVCVTYFLHDQFKNGGSYVKYDGHLKNIDEANRKMVFTDDFSIYFELIVNIEIV